MALHLKGESHTPCGITGHPTNVLTVLYLQNQLQIARFIIMSLKTRKTKHSSVSPLDVELI